MKTSTPGKALFSVTKSSSSKIDKNYSTINNIIAKLNFILDQVL